MGAKAWGRVGWVGLIARTSLVVSALVVVGSLYSWLYFSEGDVSNLTWGGMVGQTLVAAGAVVAALIAVLRAERGVAGAWMLGVMGLLMSAVWLPVCLAVWE